MSARGEAVRAMGLTLAYDTGVAAVAMWLAVEGRRWLEGGDASLFPANIAPLSAAVFAASAAISFGLTGVYRQVWRHAGWPDAVRVVQAAALAVLIFLPLMFIWNRLDGFPRFSLLVALPLWLLLLFAGRMAALSRSTHRPFQIFSGARRDAPKVLLVADAEAAAETLRQLDRALEGAPVRVLGIIEIEGLGPGRAIRGVPVLGAFADLDRMLDLLTLRYGEAPWVATAGVARRRRYMADILKTASVRKSQVMSLGDGVGGAMLEQVQPADLLTRAERELDPRPVSDLVGGARVFVTGAGGTIGSELARQCAALGPAEVVLFDASEYNLYRIELKLRRKHPKLRIQPLLGDVRDVMRIETAIREARPDVVIHAAALKHVPLMEANPCEAILTNVAGAMNTARAAIGAGVSKFVFVSTDKAVNPENVMGATKRLAELAVCRLVSGSATSASLVRFGNVLGSSGSVVPLFEEQIEAGGPVTVTHPDVTRYFMTVEEASTLVLHAAAMPDGAGEADLFVLDMGEPVRIEALAKAMIRMKGLVPGRDIEIIYSGLRSGEKLHEELVYEAESVSRSEVNGVFRVRGAGAADESLLADLERLFAVARKRDIGTARRMLGALAPEFEAAAREAARPGRVAARSG